MTVRHPVQPRHSPAPPRKSVPPRKHAIAPFRLIAAVLSIVLVAFLAAGCGGKNDSAGSAASAVSSGVNGGSSPSGAAGSDSTGSTDSTSSAAACPTSNTTSFAKSKFVLHAGLAFGAFHRYLYKPFQAGTFKSGAHGRITGFVKAGAAALFIKREVRLASEDVQANPTLCKAIGQPLQAVGDQVSSVVDKLKSGDTSAIGVLEGLVQTVESKASSSGNAIQEDSNPSLGG